MIGKIGKGKGFAGLTKYILQKEKAELLVTNLAGETPQDYYRQLAATRQLNPRVQSPVSHISISFPPNKKPPTEQLEQIVEGTLQGMGFDKNLYFAATHSDRNHFHLHIAASRINSDGKCVSDWWDKRQLEKVLRGLEQQFNLTPVPCSWEVDRSAPSTGQKRRIMREQKEYLQGKRNTPAQRPVIDRIQDAIEEAIHHVTTTPNANRRDFTSYVLALEEKGVLVAAKVTREGVVDGLRYEMEGVRFQASKLGHTQKPTIPGLQKQGVNFDLERDARTLANRAYSNKQKDKRSPLTIERLIKANPANRNLAIPTPHSLGNFQPNPPTTFPPDESMLAMEEPQIKLSEPTLAPYWNEIKSLLTTNKLPPQPNAPEQANRELWEKCMLRSAIEQLEKANTSNNPDFEIATFEQRYCAIRHNPTLMLIIADSFKQGQHIRYAAQKGQRASICNFNDEEKQRFLNFPENSSQPMRQKDEQLEL